MDNNSSKLANVKRSCQVASKVLRIVSIIVRVGMIIAFVGCGILFAMQSKIDAEIASHPEIVSDATASFGVGPIKATQDLSRFTEAGNYGIAYGVIALLAALSLLFLLIVLKELSKIFNTILENETPFSDIVLRTLKRTFIIIIVFVALGAGLTEAGFFALLFWCIYTIFQYGIELQRESDETL